MNRLMLPILIAALCIPGLSLAQAPAESQAAPTAAAIQPAKIAFINLEQVIFTCDEGKTRFSEVQKFVDDKNCRTGHYSQRSGKAAESAERSGLQADG